MCIRDSITPELPSYWTGIAGFYAADGNTQELQPWFLPVYYDYVASKPLSGAITGCPSDETCKATVKAPALVVDRSTSKLTYRNFRNITAPAELKLWEKGCQV